MSPINADGRIRDEQTCAVIGTARQSILREQGAALFPASHLRPSPPSADSPSATLASRNEGRVIIRRCRRLTRMKESEMNGRVRSSARRGSQFCEQGTALFPASHLRPSGHLRILYELRNP